MLNDKLDEMVAAAKRLKHEGDLEMLEKRDYDSMSDPSLLRCPLSLTLPLSLSPSLALACALSLALSIHVHICKQSASLPAFLSTLSSPPFATATHGLACMPLSVSRISGAM